MEKFLDFLPTVVGLIGIAILTHKRSRHAKILLFYPAIEELIFRAPLLIAFDAPNQTAWIWIFFSSILFAAAHWFNPFLIQFKDTHLIRACRFAQTMITFGLGIWLCHIAIWSQSLLLCFFVHLAWNLVMPVILTIFTAIIFRILLMLDKLLRSLLTSKS